MKGETEGKHQQKEVKHEAMFVVGRHGCYCEPCGYVGIAYRVQLWHRRDHSVGSRELCAGVSAIQQKEVPRVFADTLCVVMMVRSSLCNI